MITSTIEIRPEAWVENYSNMMYKYLMLRVKYKEIAEDIVQETFISALGARSKFSGDCTEKTWLFSIMKFKLADYYRKHYKTSTAENSSNNDFLGNYFEHEDDANHWKESTKPQTWHADVDQCFEQKEFHGVLENCLTKVPTKTASVFTLKYLEDLESKEICALLDITEANLWTLMHRAKLILRSCLEKNWFESI